VVDSDKLAEELKAFRKGRAAQHPNVGVWTRRSTPCWSPYGTNHYVMQPLTPCDEFKLIVRFDADHSPDAVWTLDGVAPRVVDSDRPSGSIVSPDRLGELHMFFRDLRQGFAYGVKWRP
jgi:hypothetical protein